MHKSSNANRTAVAILSLVILQALIAGSAIARARPPLPLFPEAFLHVWRFDDTQWWMPPNPLPSAVDNIESVESWSGYALRMSTDKPARLAYPCVDAAGRPLITCETGTLRFWFAPAWSSGETDPTNPLALGRFIEVGQWTTNASAGWWSLYLNPDRTAVYFSAHANGQGADFLQAPIDFRAGEWHLITLTYSPKGTALYIDETLVAEGEGVSPVPFPLPLGGEGQGEGAGAPCSFTIGSDALGQNLAQGFFDDFATFDRVHGADEIIRYYLLTTTFGKTTPVDLTSSTLATIKAEFDPSQSGSMAQSQPEQGSPQLNGPEGGGGPNSPLNCSNCLWLEIALTPTNTARLTLHGTAPGTNYLILSSPSLPAANWVVETWLFSTNEQDWIETLVSLDRPTVFFRAGVGEDTDGDGLPDVYESLVTGTDPNNPDTGDTGTSDGYKDSDGDGWTNLDEMRNGTNPSLWNPSPPPLLSAVLTMHPQGTNVTLTWEGASGPVSGYEISKIDGQGVGSTILASSGQSSLVDEEPRDFDEDLLHPNFQFGYNTYWIRSVYPQGYSQWSEPAPVLAPDTAFNGAIVRGPDGAIYLAVSAIPPVVQSIRLVTRLNSAPDAFNAPIHVFEVPLTNIANGGFRFPDSESPLFGGRSNSTYRVMAQAVQSGGRLSQGFETFQPYTSPWPGRDELPRRFIDGRVHLKENIDFLLRAATANQPFMYASTKDLEPSYDSPWYGRAYVSGEYTFAGFRSYYYYYFYYLDEPYLDIFLPWQENTMFRNFALHNGDTNSGGFWSTGVGFGTIASDIRAVTNPRYIFNPWEYFDSPPVLPSLLDPYSWQWSYFRYVGQGESGFDPEVGVTKSSSGSFATPIQYSLASDFRNIFGLRIQSVRLGRTTLAQYPVLPAGGLVTTNAISSYFPDVERPVLETIGYYFGQIDDHSIEFEHPRPIDPLPGHLNFSPTNTTPLFIGAVGKSMEFSGWAKQRIVNGDPNKFAYREEYFDRAYLLDSSNNVVHQTGILSEYGEFFPTEPGRVILTTKPDPDQGGIQGTSLIHVIKLQLDVNHDGVMDLAFSGPDNTTAGHPVRFWVNSDHDQPATSSEPDRDLERPGTPDYSYGRIRCQRNLEDFARLWIVGVPDLPPIQGYTATLSWRSVHGNPRINLYYARAEDGGTGYLTDTNAAQDQFTQTFFNGQLVTDYARSVAQVAPGTEFPLPIQPLSGHLLQQYYLFDGAGIGGGELVLSIRRNGTVIAESSQWVELDYVWKMFERAAITNVQQFWPEMVEQTLTSGFRVDHNPAEDVSQAKQVAVFVHGWRMTQWGAQNFAETMFKRLYWQGFQGRFAALRWPTRSAETEILPGLDLATFNRSEQIAFKSGRGTASYFNDRRRRFPEHSISVCAHSMGGIVVMESLKQLAAANQTPLNNIVLMQAAVPAQCLDSATTNLPAFVTVELSVPTPDAYLNYGVGIIGALRPAGKLINFFNQKDFALSAGFFGLGIGSWEYNESFRTTEVEHGPVTMKPNTFMGYYTDGANSLLRTNFWNQRFEAAVFGTYYGDRPTRAVTSIHELMPFVARPRSKAVGSQAGVHGQLQGGELV